MRKQILIWSYTHERRVKRNMEKVAFNVIIEKELHTNLKVVASIKGVTMLSIIEAGIRSELKEIERKEGIKCNL